MPIIYIDSIKSSIHDLPPEVLIEIFTFCAHIDAFTALNLPLVCGRWRDIVFGAPAIWQFITLDSNDHSIEYLQKRAVQWMRRCEPLMFDVEINVSERNDILPLLSPFFPQQRRWRSLQLNKPQAGLALRSDSSASRPLKEIKKLAILVRGIDSEDEEIRDIYIQGDIMQVSVDYLPPPNRLHALHLTAIHICDCTPEMLTQPSTLLRFLTACPSIEQFMFMGWALNDALTDEKTPVVYLPNLQILRLRSTCSARTILSHIHAPNLSELYLTYLNVDFVVNQAIEDGDSDDENGDFSRSPSSDRATGMGLRRLIARSDPPLQVLDMDCSDMRTKDFDYVFNKLTTLEEFSIVASDMSDQVVALLGSYRKESEGEFSLRLPRLRVLRLYDCIRLSGDAIVDALGKRVSLAGFAHGTELEEVKIVGCEAFTPSHRQKLRSQLPRTLCMFD